MHRDRPGPRWQSGDFLDQWQPIAAEPALDRQLDGRYAAPVAGGEVYVFTDWAYRSKVQFFLYESVEFSDDNMLEGGLRIGYRTGKFDVAAFARNITNDVSAVSGIDFNNLTAMVNEPRLFGVEVGIKF